ncbi:MULTISPECIES: pyrroloquinoline quinone biosynthesis protein PqqF [unclassified Pseudomonas]|uniref:pyrroloquinoline quinone biosynthesis protein PqqF n=1 Tax=unclassified Pseudomonas TaxID=196821 RepID=UPI0011EBD170|nr:MULTISPECIES: pyrroloquinoline quinone biosynthesis protein PqqF [unclassified Pseudomonas]KAA0950172.1 pyrroloquinoline quinone biosynthesis protein PqqF [Pseudomonas sp. ANT_H4]KAA0951429.1 pyrroloquinoline quinone biosynthesis protein PqqF [Pseudomonas sp. ANT_H14]
MPAPTHPHYLQLSLANGLRVSLRHAPRLKRCAAALRVAAGSHDVPLAWPGLAHFLEHLLFLGTQRFPANEGLMTYVQRHGGQLNASTRERTTDFFFEVPAQAFADALERLGDMLAHPRLAMDDQRREREVLHAEFIAWSRDATSQQQLTLLGGIATDHPLRAFHAGNRYSLPVPREGFQQALHEFYESFYQAGQMTLSLAGPQSLAELQALAQGFSTQLKPGLALPQSAPPALMAGHERTYLHPANDHLHQVIACEGPREALDFLCTWLNAPAPGGLLAELQARQLITALHAAPLYQFNGQALLDIDFTLGAEGAQQTGQIEEVLRDWLSFFARSDWSLLHEEYALLIARQQQISGALALARQDSEGLEPGLSKQSAVALKSLLDSLQLEPSRHAWLLPPSNPFLRPVAKAEQPGLIRGQTSAHRGLRTFAQDRSRGRRDLSALAFSQALADDSSEGALYLRWRLDSPLRASLFPRMESSLLSVRENARQAGVEVTFEAVGNDWLLKLIGLHEPMPAVLEQLSRVLTQPDERAWQMTLHTPAPLIAIRQLLKVFTHSAAASLPVSLSDLQSLWSTATWDGLGTGIPEACQIAIKSVAGRLPGQPASIAQQAESIAGQYCWQTVATDSSEAALLLFCPTPTQSLADEANWRLLAYLAQAPFYQRLRVELQLGYAVFSGIRQINGQTGLLFGVQSPSVCVKEILDHIQTFLTQLPTWIDASDDLPQLLASQFSPQALPTAQAGELLWQAHLAGHPSDYLKQLHACIQTRTKQDLLDAARQLNQATGGWHCLASRPGPGEPWQPTQ